MTWMTVATEFSDTIGDGETRALQHFFGYGGWKLRATVATLINHIAQKCGY